MAWMESISFRRAALAIAAVCLLVYGMNVTHSFVWDDGYNVVQNTEIRDLTNVPTFFTEAWGASAESTHSRALNSNYWRPVALTSYAIDHALFGLNAWGFHLVNILWHTACSLLVLLLGWRLFPAVGRERVGVIAGALVFAVHPVHTEVVNVITYRTDMLAAFFTLLGLVLWVGVADSENQSKRRRTQFGWVPLVYFLGVGSKEMAFTLPLLVLCYELLVRRTSLRRLAVTLAPLGLVALGYLLIRKSLLSPSPMVYFDINWPTHLPAGGDGVVLTMLSVVTLYGKLLVAPWPLNPFYEWSPDVLPVQVDPLESSVLIGVLIVGAWTVVAAKLIKHDRRLAFLWFLMPVVLIPVSHVIPIIIAAGERFLYLALLGPSMVAAIVLFRRFGAHPVLVSSVCLICLVFASMSIVRSHQWRSDEAILEAYVTQWPTSYNAWKGLHDYRLGQAKDAWQRGDKEEVGRLRSGLDQIGSTMKAIERSAWQREADNLRYLEETKLADCIVNQLEQLGEPRLCFGAGPLPRPRTNTP